MQLALSATQYQVAQRPNLRGAGDNESYGAANTCWDGGCLPEQGLRVVAGGESGDAALRSWAAWCFGAHKMSQSHAKQIEEQTGVPPEELEDDDLEAAMAELNIPKHEFTAEDHAAGADIDE